MGAAYGRVRDGPETVSGERRGLAIVTGRKVAGGTGGMIPRRRPTVASASTIRAVWSVVCSAVTVTRISA